MRAILTILLTLPLSGCWFVFIPGSAISAVGDALGGYQGNMCVSESAQIGNKINMPDGTTGTVKKLEGTHSRCSNPALPIRAVVVQD